MRIYLSSTLNDLLPERAAVKSALAGMHTIVESYDADEKSVRESCLEDVAGCDACILIVGLRYGFIPPGDEKSITELEFDAACKAGKRILVFLKAPGDIKVTGCDSHTKENDPVLIEGFRKKLESGGAGAPRPAVVSTPEELKTKLLRALLNKKEETTGESAALVLAPAGDTELQTMLAKVLNNSWASCDGVSRLMSARLIVDSETIASERKGWPFDVFRMASLDRPEDVFSRLDCFVVGDWPATLRVNPDLREIVLLVALVAAERFVKVMRVEGNKSLRDDESIGGKDARLSCILAAASFGFGVKLKVGKEFPHNFAKPSIAEVGYEDARQTAKFELYAQAKHMKGIDLPRTSSDKFNLCERLLSAEIKDISALFGCRLVLVGEVGGALADPVLRNGLHDEFGVPTVFYSQGLQPRRDADWLLQNLQCAIGRLLDEALGPCQKSE